MKHPVVCALLIPVVGVSVIASPGATACFIGMSVVIFGACQFDRLCCSLQAPIRLALKRLLHTRFVKPPANLVSNGVVLSVVLFSLGFLWNSLHVTIPPMPGGSILSMLNIVAHLLCLGGFISLLGFLQSAPDFRSSRG